MEEHTGKFGRIKRVGRGQGQREDVERAWIDPFLLEYPNETNPRLFLGMILS